MDHCMICGKKTADGDEFCPACEPSYEELMNGSPRSAIVGEEWFELDDDGLRIGID